MWTSKRVYCVGINQGNRRLGELYTYQIARAKQLGWSPEQLAARSATEAEALAFQCIFLSV